MKKSEWIEEHNKEIELYDKSLIHNSDNEYDSIKDYETHIGCNYNNDESDIDYYDGTIKHFQDY